jgi:fumarate hydratase class I
VLLAQWLLARALLISHSLFLSLDLDLVYRPGHLQQLASILKDPEASDNDRFVALELLKNANIASGALSSQEGIPLGPATDGVTLATRLNRRVALVRRAGMILPSCQDTGTAIVMAKKGQYVWTSGDDEAAISKGIYQTYTQTNLR